ncbi:MAG: LysM peptidoglycan-binding domain-containing protein [Bacteroidia bacterium]|nr:LysM peptidoglycan-binding domain-containing protein [Bacteroidia bacterium]RZW54546.1 MAG: LysM peptidoglycan-binding domain-containing protein [Flavobacteriaceae bacterium]
MKKLFLSLNLLLCMAMGFAQDYKTHKVKVGETIESIAKTYMVTPYDIYALNPDAKIDLQPNEVIVIPKSRIAQNPTTTTEQKVSGFKKHKVRRKETLFSISKKYNVSIDDIKKHNKRLYSENLRKGDKINIPQFSTIQVTNNLENTIRKYKVQPKEGKWRIAYKFGITVDELETLNPKMSETLQEGEEINVPNLADNEVKKVDDEFGYYTVLPKEGFYRLKLKLGLSQMELEDLNPQLSSTGLKAGMVLKVPRDVGTSSELTNIDQTALKSKLTNFSTKRLAIMLPFRLHRIDLDSIREAKDILQRDSYMSISIDFHSGVLMALDSAKQLGISTNLDVFDTQARLSEVSKILASNDFSNYDAVIGPFTSENFDRIADELRNKRVPVFAPVTMPKKLYANVYQTIPSDEYLRKTLTSFVQSDSLPKKIIIISDQKNKSVSDALKSDFPSAKQIFSRKNKKGDDANYILISDIETEIQKGLNIVFLQTANEGFVSNVTSMLSAINGTDFETQEKREIILMTTNYNRAFEGTNVSNYDLSSLKFHYPSVNRTLAENSDNGFVKRYKAKYRSEPNKYATRGFDLAMDILLRLAYKDSLDEASGNDLETEYVENKFRYAKKLFGGYYNESAYILKFDDLRIIEAKK